MLLDVINGLIQGGNKLIKVFLIQEDLMFVVTIPTESPLALGNGNVEVVGAG